MDISEWHDATDEPNVGFQPANIECVFKDDENGKVFMEINRESDEKKLKVYFTLEETERIRDAEENSIWKWCKTPREQECPMIDSHAAPRFYIDDYVMTPDGKGRVRSIEKGQEGNILVSCALEKPYEVTDPKTGERKYGFPAYSFGYAYDTLQLKPLIQILVNGQE